MNSNSNPSYRSCSLTAFSPTVSDPSFFCLYFNTIPTCPSRRLDHLIHFRSSDYFNSTAFYINFPPFESYIVHSLPLMLSISLIIFVPPFQLPVGRQGKIVSKTGWCQPNRKVTSCGLTGLYTSDVW